MQVVRAALPVAYTLFAAQAIAAEDTTDDSDDIVVIGTPSRIGEAGPASVTTVRIDERLPTGADVADVMDAVPGATVRRLGGPGSWSGVSLRGSTFRQVQVHLDGVPLNPDGTASVDLSELPLHAFDRIQVWRSQPPPWLAAAPIGGVVDLITPDKLGTHRVVLGGGSQSSWSASGFSGGTVKVARLPVQVLASASGIGSRGDFRFYDDGILYDPDDDEVRRRSNNQLSRGTGLLRLRTGNRRRGLSLLATGSASDRQLSGPVGALPMGALASQQMLLSLDGTHTIDATELRARAWALRRTEQHTLSGDTTSGLTVYAGAVGTARRIVAPWAVVGATVDTRVDSWRSDDDSARRISGTLAVDTDMYLLQDRIRLWPVVRAQGRSSSHAGKNTSKATIRPRIGVSWRAHPHVHVHGHIGSYERPPDFVELYAQRGASKGNDQLAPEAGWLADLGARADTGGDMLSMQAEAAVFHRNTRDLIVYVQNAQRQSLPVNLDRARVQGVEGGLSLSALRHVDARTAITLQRAHTWAGEGTQHPIPRLPRLQITQQTSFHAGERARIGHSLRWSERTPLDAAGFDWTARRVLHDAFARVQPIRRGPSLELQVRNLANRISSVEPRNPLVPGDTSTAVRPTTDFAGYPLPGRSLWLHIRWTLTTKRSGSSP